MQLVMDDKVVWLDEKSGLFPVQSLFKVLQLAPLLSFPANIIRHSKVQSRVCFFFVWEVAWGKVQTLDWLQKGGRSLANRCFLCQRHEETMDHLLLHCVKTRVLW